MNLKETFLKCTNGPWFTAGDDVKYRIESTSDSTDLFFKCTSSNEDWKSNFNFWVEPYKNMPTKWYAHRGFIKAWKSIQEVIFNSISKENIIRIFGYSRGGAIATLAHEDFIFNGYECETLTFGSPRVVWLPKKIIRKRFDAVKNVRVCGDLFAHLPPALFGYRRIGIDHKIGNIALISPWKHTPDSYLKGLE